MRIAVCGTFSAACIDLAGRRRRLRTGVSAACAGSAPNIVSIAARGLGRVDRADDDDMEIVARHRARVERLEVVGGDRRDAFDRAFARAAIGMVAEERLRPEPPTISFGSDSACRRFAVIWPRMRVDRLGVEARLVDRHAEELEGLVLVGRERAQIAVEGVGAGIEGELDAEILELRLEGARSRDRPRPRRAGPTSGWRGRPCRRDPAPRRRERRCSWRRSGRCSPRPARP